MIKFRTQYFINPKVQMTMIGTSILMTLVVSIVSLTLLIKYFGNIQESFLTSGLNESNPIVQYLLMQKTKVVKMLIFTTVVSFIINGLLMTWLTHKIVGPVYRMHKSLESLLNDNELKIVKVRKGDFFVDTVELLEKVRQRGLK